MSSQSIHLKNLTLDDLAGAYIRACCWQKMLINPDSNVRFAVGKSTNIEKIIQMIVIDKDHIWQSMITKIPRSHILQIETIKKEMALSTNDSPKIIIATGQRWEHKHTPGMIIEINATSDDGRWVCGLYLANKYKLICNMREHTIFTHFKKLDV